MIKNSKFLAAAFMIMMVTINFSFAQNTNNISKWMQQVAATPRDEVFPSYKVFNSDLREKKIDPVFGEMEKVSLLPDALNSVITDEPATMELEIPSVNNSTVILQLAEVNILTSDFNVGTKSSSGTKGFNYKAGVFYRGIIKGDENSTATISFFQNEMIGVFSNSEGTFTVGKLNDESEDYVIYNSTKSNYHPVMNCETDDSNYQIELNSIDRGVGCKEVSVYFECDYQMYLDKGSDVTNVVNYVTGLFGQVATMYANENIVVTLQSVYVWTVSDPFVSYSTASSLLSPFASSHSPFTTANLGHFLSTRSIGGGVAWLNVLCSQYSNFAVSGIYNSYNTVPTYSWSVEVISHEMGHNFGSPHTHSCSWTGGALDDCGPTAGYPTEGGCANGPTPVGGGTVMSYCHLVSGVGINFNNGFGIQPGDLIRARTIAANCVNAVGTVPTGMSVSGLSASTVTLSWNPVASVTNYIIEYKTAAATSWTSAGNTSSTSMPLYNLVVNTAYNWHVKTDCSNFTANGNFTTSNYTCLKPTGLTSTNITATSAQLNWAAVSGATSYVVQYRLSVTTTWTNAGVTTNNFYPLTGLYGSATYKWRVKANCSQYSTVATFSTSVTSCLKPTGLAAQYIGGTYAYLTWTAVAGAAYYSVYYRVTGTTAYTLLGTAFYNNFYASPLNPSTSYDWKVKANCSVYSSKNVFVTTADTGQGGGTGGNIFAQDFDVYPNPAVQQITIKQKEKNDLSLVIEVSDLLGRIIISQPATNLELISTNYKLDVSTLNSGVYFISLKDEMGNKRVKSFIKE